MVGGRRGGRGRVRLYFGVPVSRRRAGFVVEVSADPIEEFFAAGFGGDEDGVVEGDEADTAFHELVDLGEAIVVEERMGFFVVIGTIGEEEDRGGIFEDGGVLGPTVEDDFGFDVFETGGGVQTSFEKFGAFLIFVVSWAVAFGAGDEDDFLRRFFRDGRRCGDENDRQNESGDRFGLEERVFIGVGFHCWLCSFVKVFAVGVLIRSFVFPIQEYRTGGASQL